MAHERIAIAEKPIPGIRRDVADARYLLDLVVPGARGHRGTILRQRGERASVPLNHDALLSHTYQYNHRIKLSICSRT